MNYSSFLKKKETIDFISFEFKGKNENYNINVDKKFKSYENCPIGYYCAENIWKSPLWFRKLHEETNHLYYEENKLRLLTFNERRSLENIMWACCLPEEFGEELYDLVGSMMDIHQEYYIPKKYINLWEKISKIIKKERYIIEIKNENKEEIHFMIK